MKKKLFLCNTLYQIICASAIRNMFPNDEVDIILSDHSVGNIKIFNRLTNNTIVFNHVFYVESKKFFVNDKNLSRREFYLLLKNDSTIENILDISDIYDDFFCANVDPLSLRLVNYLKRKNRKLKINWFEDGLTAYSYDKCYFPNFLGNIKAVSKWLLFRIYSVTPFVNNFFVFKKDKMEWKPNAKIVEIEPISRNLANQLGDIFSVSKCIDKYKEKFIFFEDGAMDWNDESDVEVVKLIVDLVGKENLFVKLHPRNPKNRFEKYGITTNKDVSIPWEVIATNIEIESKILLTMYSQSVITPDILMNKKAKVISLAYLDRNYEKTNHAVYDYIKKNYYDNNKDVYFTPKSIDELVEIVNEIM